VDRRAAVSTERGEAVWRRALPKIKKLFIKKKGGMEMNEKSRQGTHDRHKK